MTRRLSPALLTLMDGVALICGRACATLRDRPKGRDGSDHVSGDLDSFDPALAYFTDAWMLVLYRVDLAALCERR